MRKGMDISGLDAKGPHYRELVDIIAFGSSILSGIPFNHEGGLTWDSPSIDQKESGKGYAWENIRVVLAAENSAMGTWGKEVAMYVFACCLLRESEKRGDSATVLAVLRALISKYKPEELCPSSTTTAPTAAESPNATSVSKRLGKSNSAKSADTVWINSSHAPQPSLWESTAREAGESREPQFDAYGDVELRHG